MSKLIELISCRLVSWAIAQPPGRMGRVPLSQLPLNEEDWPALAKGLCESMNLQVVGLPLETGESPRRQLAEPPTIVIFALRSIIPSPENWPSAVVVSQDFAVKLRDARSQPGSHAGQSRWVVFMDREMDSIRTASVCLTDPGNPLDPVALIRDLVPGLAQQREGFFNAVKGDFLEVLRDPSRSPRLNESLGKWSAGQAPSMGQLLSGALGWFEDSDLDNLLRTQTEDAVEHRIQTNRTLSQKAKEMRARNADSSEWEESFPELTDAQRRNLREKGPETVELRDASVRPAREKFEDFRFRTLTSVLTRLDGKHHLHVLISRGLEYRVTLVYSCGVDQMPFRLWLNGVEAPSSSSSSWISVTGRTLTLTIPPNGTNDPFHIVLNLYFRKATSRGEPTEVVRVLQLPLATPEVYISDFRIGDAEESCLVLDTSEGLIVETPQRRATTTNPAVDAFDGKSMHELPANIRAGAQNMAQWRFRTEIGELVLPIRCTGPETEEGDEVFRGVLLLSAALATQDNSTYWVREPEGRGIKSSSGICRIVLSTACSQDLFQEHRLVESGWISPIQDNQGRVVREGDIPAVIRTHAKAQAILEAYETLFQWLKKNGTLPSLVAASDPSYWPLVDRVLESVQEYVLDPWDGPEKMEWVAQLGTFRSSVNFVEKTGPFWPPALWMAAQLSKRVREGSISPDDLPVDSFSPANIVPLNLWMARSPQFGMARSRGLWSWLDWKPLDRSFDRTYPEIGRIFTKRMRQFLASFPNLSTAEIPSPLKVRFVRILPDKQLVAGVEAFISRALSEGRWTPEHQVEFEFMLETPELETLLDERLDPSVEKIDPNHGFDLLHRCLRVRKVPIEFLYQPPENWDRYAHVTFVGGQTTYQMGARPATELEPSCAVGGMIPIQLVDLAPRTRRNPTPRGPGIGSEPDAGERFPALWNHAIVSATGQRPWNARDPRYAPCVTPVSAARNAAADLGAHSLWLAYIEPGVGLLPLTGDWNLETGDSRRMLVHFTTIGRIGAPGYSDITVTEKLRYLEKGLDPACRAFGFKDVKTMVSVMHSLNGEWILKLVQGLSRGSQGEALLATVATGHLLLERLRNKAPEFEWVVAGWEDFHYVTGGAGRSSEDAGIVSPDGGSDDILLIGISRSEPRRIRIVLGESKFGQAPLKKGAEQLQETHTKLVTLYSSHGFSGEVERARLGNYVLLAAERMATHRLLTDDTQTWLHENQRQLLVGDYEIDEGVHAHIPTVGFLVHVDPEASRVDESVSEGILRLRVPGGQPHAAVSAEGPRGANQGPALSPNQVTATTPPSPRNTTNTTVTIPAAPIPLTPAVLATEVISPVNLAPSGPAAAAVIAGSSNQPNVNVAESSAWTGAVLARIPPAHVEKSPPPSDQVFSIDRILSQFGIRVDPPEREDVVVGPQATVVHLRMGPGVTVNRIRNALESLQLALGSTQPLISSTSTKGGHISIFIPQKERRMVPLEYGLLELPQQRGSLPIPVGLLPTNEMLWLDLRDANHLLIAGATGSGKTIYLRGALLTLMARFEPSRLRVHLVDPKQLDFVQFENAPHLAELPVNSLEGAVEMLGSLLEEIGRRRARLAQERFSDIYEHNKNHPDAELPYHLVVVDEYNQLRLSADPDASRELEARVCQLAQIGRAFGVYLIVATQRPSVEVITGDIKANFPTRMSFRVASGVDSRVILDRDGAERLLGNGDGLVIDGSGNLSRFQALYNDQASTRTILQAIQSASELPEDQ